MTKNNKSFYNSSKWKSKRLYILQRDKYLCQMCKRYGRNTEAKIVHHIEEIEDRPDLALKNNNLAALCPSCHNKIHPEKGTNYIRK
jgi:5-methylcytosine-specific restriction enzyme A